MWLYRFDDYWQKQQMIYPSSSLTQMQGNKITALTFYANGNISSVSGGVIEVSLGTTSSTTFSSSALITGLTKKATFAMNSTVISGSQLTITLDSPYEYNGGNLVIEFNKTTNGSGYQNQTFAFYGVSQSGYTSIYQYKSSENGSFSTPSRLRFLPQVTFTYEAKPAHDLSIALSAPASVGAGNSVTLTATVTNNGTNAESGYTVTFRDGNNNVIDTQTGGSLAAGANTTFTTTYTTTAAQGGTTVNFTANVNCTGDADASNNSATASTSVITLPPPENVVATAGENQTATVTWDLPIIATTPATLTWDFEEQSDLADFTTIDSDGDGYNWGWHYNTGSGNYTVNTGSGVAYSESYSNNAGAALSPDNWMISPEVTLGGTLTFYAAHQATYPEKFAVYVCQGPYSDVSSFTKIYGDITTTGTMTKHTIDLSQYAGQGYFAIRHYNVSDQFILLIDDITLEYAAGNYPISYNVYLDGTLVGNVSSSDPRSFTFNNLSSGTHQCAVSAVYNEGESAQVPAVIPTFEPFTNGTVSPSNVDFGTKNIGGSYTATVTVTNTGNQSFTPTIDVTNLPQGISVSPTTSSALAPNSTLDLTVTFEPTAEQSYSGTFTVTIPVPNDNDIVVTVTVTGSGFYANRLTSNTVEIPVYKSEAKADGTYIFSKNDVDGDINRTLSYGNGNVNVEVLVKDEEPVTSYDLRHKVGSGNWSSIATATQDASNPKVYAYNNETFTIPNDATEMWIPMTDAGVDASSVIYYVPVTYANGIVTQGNTYGAPQVQAETDFIDVSHITITGHKSDLRPGGHWKQTVNGQEVDYCVYTLVVTVEDVAFNENRVPYMLRSWLLPSTIGVPYYDFARVVDEDHPTGHIVGTDLLNYPKLLGEFRDFDGLESGPFVIGIDYNHDEHDSSYIPDPDPWGDEEDKLMNAFAAPSDLSDRQQTGIVVAVRAYYYKVDETPSGLRGNRDGNAPADGYGMSDGEGEAGTGSIATAVMELTGVRQVVDVKYVNVQGMQSDKPFDGVNIVVTRYSDGTTTATKVMR